MKIKDFTLTGAAEVPEAAAEPHHHIRGWSNFINLSEANVKNSTSYRLNVLSSSKKAAFTLAEVLITLAIIGVVAAMTIPTLVSKYQENVRVTKLKRAYSEVSQALKLAEAEHGTMETWDFSNYENSLERSSYFAENYIFKYFKLSKKCIPTTKECWFSNVSTRASAITTRGYSLQVWLDGLEDDGKGGVGGWVHVDIDGPNHGLNTYGKDIFRIKFVFRNGFDSVGDEIEHGVYFYGLQYKIQKTRDELIEGNYCEALILLDGWKISDDNPCK